MPRIEERVIQIIADQPGMEPARVVPEASFIDDLVLARWTRVELIMAFEESFGMEIPDDHAERIATVQNAIEYIQRNAKSIKQ